jgi:predicted DNA-binding WGR domain protein
MRFSRKPHSHKTPNAAIRDVTPIHLERREPTRNRQRFYAITVTRTLFDQWAVIREWGRIGQPGTVRETWFETEGEAWAAGNQWRRRKERRGYRAVGG